jgi:hypothetical protein
MAQQADQDIEFVPSDDIVEPELAGAEDDAVHVRETEEPRGLMAVDADDFDADQLEEEEVEELEAEAAESAAEAAQEAADEEHEEDLEEILRRHYGIVSAEPDEGPGGWPAGAEFVCRVCFLRKPSAQLADPARSICVDCAP